MRKETGLGMAIAMMLAAGTAQAQVIDLKSTWSGTSEAIFVGPAAHHAKPGAAASAFQAVQAPTGASLPATPPNRPMPRGSFLNILV